MRGRKPKPPAVRRLEGNPGKRPIHDEAKIGTAVAEVDEFAAPATLHPKAVVVWNEIVPDLVEVGLVRTIDATVLEALCTHVAIARVATERLGDDLDDYLDVTEKGTPVVSPHFRVFRDSWAAAVKLAEQYGLTPIGRLRLGVAALKQKTLAEELRAALDGDEDDDVVEDGEASIDDEVAALDAEEIEEAEFEVVEPESEKAKPAPKKKAPAKKKTAPRRKTEVGGDRLKRLAAEAREQDA